MEKTANPAKLGFMFQKKFSSDGPKPACQQKYFRAHFCNPFGKLDTITWTPEPSKLGAGLEAQPPGVGEPLNTTEETVDEATKRSFSESKKSSKSSTGCGVVVVLRVAGRGVVVAKVRT